MNWKFLLIGPIYRSAAQLWVSATKFQPFVSSTFTDRAVNGEFARARAAAAGLDDRPETSIRSFCRWDFLERREFTTMISQLTKCDRNLLGELNSNNARMVTVSISQSHGFHISTAAGACTTPREKTSICLWNRKIALKAENQHFSKSSILCKNYDPFSTWQKLLHLNLNLLLETALMEMVINISRLHNLNEKH